MLEDAVAIAGLLGFGLSIFLGILKFQEWRAKPDLRLEMDWIVGGGPSTLFTHAILIDHDGRNRAFAIPPNPRMPTTV